MILFLEFILDEYGSNWCYRLEPSYTSLQIHEQRETEIAQGRTGLQCQDLRQAFLILFILNVFNSCLCCVCVPCSPFFMR